MQSIQTTSMQHIHITVCSITSGPKVHYRTQVSTTYVYYVYAYTYVHMTLYLYVHMYIIHCMYVPMYVRTYIHIKYNTMYIRILLHTYVQYMTDVYPRCT